MAHLFQTHAPYLDVSHSIRAMLVKRIGDAHSLGRHPCLGFNGPRSCFDSPRSCFGGPSLCFDGPHLHLCCCHHSFLALPFPAFVVLHYAQEMLRRTHYLPAAVPTCFCGQYFIVGVSTSYLYKPKRLIIP